MDDTNRPRPPDYQRPDHEQGPQHRKRLYPDPRHWTRRERKEPYDPGKSYPAPRPGKWSKEIDAWLKRRQREHEKEKEHNRHRVRMPRPYLDCTSNFGPQLDDFGLNVPGSMSFTVWNDGNFPAWTCYVELYEGPWGYSSPLSAYQLRGRRIITLMPGEQREVAVPWTRRLNQARVVGIVFDPLLDPRDFALVEQHNRHITSIHYTF